MADRKQFVLKKRDPGTGPFFVSNHTPGEALPQPIREGNTVELNCDDVMLTVRVTEASTPHFKGELLFFEQRILADLLHAVKVGDVISFEYHHVFSCSQS